MATKSNDSSILALIVAAVLLFLFFGRKKAAASPGQTQIAAGAGSANVPILDPGGFTGMGGTFGGAGATGSFFF